MLNDSFDLVCFIIFFCDLSNQNESEKHYTPATYPNILE